MDAGTSKEATEDEGDDVKSQAIIKFQAGKIKFNISAKK
jgi:hypothetical protein